MHVWHEVGWRSVQVRWDILDVRTHDGDVVFGPVVQIQYWLVYRFVFVSLFVLELQEYGEDLETKIKKITLAFYDHLQIVHNLGFKLLLALLVVAFRYPVGYQTYCLEQKQYAFKIVLLSFGQHFWKEGVEVIVVLYTNLS